MPKDCTRLWYNIHVIFPKSLASTNLEPWSNFIGAVGYNNVKYILHC